MTGAVVLLLATLLAAVAGVSFLLGRQAVRKRRAAGHSPLFDEIDLVTGRGKVAAVIVLLGCIVLIALVLYLTANGIDGGFAV